MDSIISTESQTLCCGMPGATRDRAGRWTYYDYDQLKRPIRLQDPTGNTLEMKYDAGGNLTRLLDAKGNATRFAYDAIGRLQTKTYADNTSVAWNYDALGRMDAQRDAQGKVTRYLYDDDDRLRKIDYPTSADVTVNYDAQDRPSSVTDAIGTTKVAYDELNRVTSVDGPWASDTVSYEYDAVGRRKTLRVNGVAGVGGEDASYVYDTLGRLQKLTGMAGEFNYSYVGETGALSQLQLPNGTKAVYGYDNLERLMSLTNQKNTGELLSRYAYGYEETHAGGNYALRGLRTSMDSQLSDLTSGAVQQAQRTLYAYSGDSQLTGESTTPIAGQGQNTASSWSRSYGYDAMGNRTSATQTNEDGVISNSSSTANKLNQLTSYSTNVTTATTSDALASALIYDARGNLSEQASKVNGDDAGKSRYVYDDLNRLVSLTSLDAVGNPQGQTRFAYDSISRKCVQATFSWNNGAWQKTSEKRYLYDGLNVVQERDENNAVIASNLWAGSVGGLLARRTQNATLFPSYDANGNVTGLTDASGARVAKYRYDAFGNTLEASGPQAASNPYRFSTKEAVGGLYDYGFRFYSPGLGRWINRDPIEEAGGLNVYAFCANNPVTCIDFDGLKWREIGGIVGGIGGAMLGGGPFGAAAGSALGSFLGSLADDHFEGRCPDVTQAVKNGLIDGAFSLGGAVALGGVFRGVQFIGKFAGKFQGGVLNPAVLGAEKDAIKAFYLARAPQAAKAIARYNRMRWQFLNRITEGVDVTDAVDGIAKGSAKAVRVDFSKGQWMVDKLNNVKRGFGLQAGNLDGIYAKRAADHELTHLGAMLKNQPTEGWSSTLHEMAVNYAVNPEGVMIGQALLGNGIHTAWNATGEFYNAYAN